jgi:hypothetical protein
MPFGSFQESPQQAFRSAARMMAAGAHMVKLEGGATMVETTRFLVDRGIPVCAHIGLTPQSVNTLGGYRVQGKDEKAALLSRWTRRSSRRRGGDRPDGSDALGRGQGRDRVAQGAHHRHRRRAPTCPARCW